MSNIAKPYPVLQTGKAWQKMFPFTCTCTKKFRNLSSKTANNNHKSINEENMIENKKETLSWEQLIDYSKLSPLDISIHQRHADAVRVSLLYMY